MAYTVVKLQFSTLVIAEHLEKLHPTRALLSLFARNFIIPVSGASLTSTAK
jgi:hypothetical protein